MSRICAELDETVEAFRSRRLDHVEFPYAFSGAACLKVRNSVSQVTSKAMVVATGVTSDGRREILGCDIGDSEDGCFWQRFLDSLVDRGLAGVRLVTSDACRGLNAAADRVLQGTVRQRCRVHFTRNLSSRVPRSHQQMAATVLKTIFAQPDAAAVRGAWGSTSTPSSIRTSSPSISRPRSSCGR